MDRIERVDGFQLDDDPVLHHEVQPVVAVEQHALVDDRYDKLSLHRQVPDSKLITKALFVMGF